MTGFIHGKNSFGRSHMLLIRFICDKLVPFTDVHLSGSLDTSFGQMLHNSVTEFVPTAKAKELLVTGQTILCVERQTMCMCHDFCWLQNVIFVRWFHP